MVSTSFSRQPRASRPRVRVLVERGLKPQVDPSLVLTVAEKALQAEGVPANTSLTVRLVSDETIRELNRRYRGINKATDVLSFPLVERGGAQFVLPPRITRELGDVVVSYDRAVEQARRYGHSLERELGYLVVHGVLHILGYDHEKEEERKQMRAREEAIMQEVGLSR